MTDQNANIEAINRYILTQTIHTAKAAALKDEWIANYGKLGWYEKSFDSTIYDWVRNRRNDFDYANAPTAEALAAAKHQHTQGLSSEQLRGEEDQRLASKNVAGSYLEPAGVVEEVAAEQEPFIPTRIKVVAALGAVAYFGFKFVKKNYLDRFLNLAKAARG